MLLQTDIDTLGYRVPVTDITGLVEVISSKLQAFRIVITCKLQQN